VPAELVNYRSKYGEEMNVKPTNRNLLISIPVEEVEEASSAFILPESYKKKEIERHTVVDILAVSSDCQRFDKSHEKMRCVVETSMINKIKVDLEMHNIIAENYVVLLLEE
jgi:hypothetical protein